MNISRQWIQRAPAPTCREVGGPLQRGAPCHGTIGTMANPPPVHMRHNKDMDESLGRVRIQRSSDSSKLAQHVKALWANTSNMRIHRRIRRNCHS